MNKIISAVEGYEKYGDLHGFIDLGFKTFDLYSVKNGEQPSLAFYENLLKIGLSPNQANTLIQKITAK